MNEAEAKVAGAQDRKSPEWRAISPILQTTPELRGHAQVRCWRSRFISGECNGTRRCQACAPAVINLSTPLKPARARPRRAGALCPAAKTEMDMVRARINDGTARQGHG